MVPLVGWSFNIDSLKTHVLSLDGEAQVEAVDDALKEGLRSDSSDFYEIYEFVSTYAATSSNGEQIELRSQYRLAMWHVFEGEFEQALIILNNIARVARRNGNPGFLFRYEYLLSQCYESLGSLDIALEHALKAMNFAKKSGESELIMRSFNSLGEIYRELREFDQAISYYDDGLEVARETGDSITLPRLLNNKGISLTQLEEYDDAFDCLDEALKVSTATGDVYGQSRLLTNLGFLFKKKEEYQEALRYYFESVEIKQKLGSNASTAYSLNDIGEVHYFMGDYRSAIAYSRRALTLAKKANVITYQRDISKTISKSFEKYGQHDSALYYRKNYESLKDTIINADNLRNIARLERMNELNQAQMLNQVLRNENEAKALALTTQRWILALLTALALSLIGLIGLILNTSRTRKNLLFLVEERNAKLDETNRELRRLLNEQDSIFNIVTHDLKGPLVNILQLIELEESELDQKEKKELRQLLKSSASGAAQFIEEFNTLLEFERKNEMPPNEEVSINQLITEILKDFQSQIKNKNISVHFNDKDGPAIQTVRTMLHHILHNLISNAIKFNPSSSNIFITITHGDNTRISIEDQGPGISEEDLGRIFEKFFKKKTTNADGSRSNGLGLPLVKLLCEKLGGSIKVKSTIGEGSEFIVHLP